MYEIDAANRVRVGGERAHYTCGAHVPEEESFVVGTGGEDVATGGEREGVNVGGMGLERMWVGFSCYNIPKTDGFVVAT